ncbi:MAG: imidazole glycerol phosphate synthase subunit HisH [Actinomycetota bacterium]
MTLRTALIDHGMGNLRSVAKALEAAGADVVLTSDRSTIDRCAAMCVPGQGIFGRCVTNLSSGGLDESVRDWIAKERPYLGICLGMQVLFDESEERGGGPGLGIVPGSVTRLPESVTVPHIGWNRVDDEYFYFDHSYAPHPSDESDVAGWCEHGDRFAAWIETGSITAVQFHPEKSGRAGIDLLSRWAKAAA